MNELWIILTTRWWLLRNKAAAVGKQSSLKITIILLFISLYGVGSFFGLWYGFDYIANTMGLGYFLVDRLFYMFFFVLLGLLTISQVIITYSIFYRSREVAFFFSLPVSYPVIFSVKFLEATFLSSWAVAFLVLPLLLAYGASRSLGINFYFYGLGLAIPFIFIAAAWGTVIGMLLVNFFSHKSKKIIIILLLAAAAVSYWYYRQINQPGDWQTGDLGLLLDRLFQHTRLSLSPFLPSGWITRGLLAKIQNNIKEYIFNLLLLLSTALFFTWLAVQAARKIYYPSWQSLAGSGSKKNYLPKRSRFFKQQWDWLAIAGRDLKLFYRDPAQWSQFAIFFGIIGIYILNIRQMHYDLGSIFWKNLISYLNLGTIVLTLGTLCTRFVFPQWSLECRRLWLVGLLPVSLGRILIMKFILNSILGLAIVIPLMAVSNFIIGLPFYLAGLSLVTLLAAGLALPGLALGLGTIFPNYEEDDIAKIVAGFGGTLTLILSLLYILIILGLEIVPLHLYFTKRLLTKIEFIRWISLSICLLTVVSLVAGGLPLLLGWRLIQQGEFKQKTISH